jgi:thiol-disulfide isomerase/thioredoxin
MQKPVQNRLFARFWSFIKPWLLIIAIFLILHFTGAISSLSNLAGSVVMSTGAMDASAPTAPPEQKDFDYNFQLRDISGKTVNMTDFKNKTIFLNLWATWCGPCRMEMPSIQNLYDQVDRNKIVFIMLSLDNPAHDSKVSQYVNKEAFTFPVYRPIDELPAQLRVPSIPTTFIISPEGKIVTKNVGAANYDNKGFKKFLEELSEGKN